MSLPTSEQIRERYDYDAEHGILVWRVKAAARVRIGTAAGSVNGNGRMLVKLQDGKLHLAARVIWCHVHGHWPNQLIDHINGNPLDNRIANLREATHTQNQANTRIRMGNTSGFKGVHLDRATGKWRAQLRVNGTTVRLGKRYDTPQQAHDAYVAAAAAHFGEFARPQ